MKHTKGPWSFVKNQLIEILSNGENRPLSPPNVQGRLEHTVRQLTAIADWIEKMSRDNPNFLTTFAGYKNTNAVREEILNLIDISLLLNEFYKLDENTWMRFNTEYINNKGES